MLRARLNAECADDADLRREVERLLRDREEVAEFLEEPVVSLLAERPSEVPDQVGPYRLEERLGRGGMGEVFRATREDGVFQKDVAIKVLRPDLTFHDLSRFRLERQTLASLEHPNIARILDGGSLEDGRPYLVMELVRGRDLLTYCDEENLPLPDRLRLFLDACEGVQAAHAALVVHRDLKPTNILVSDEGIPKLIDFGISAGPRARSGTRRLTLGYASPEEITGSVVTPAADVYSLGVILFELLAGRRPLDLGERSLREVRSLLAKQELPTLSGTYRTLMRTDRDRADRVASQRKTTARALLRKLSGDLETVVAKAMSYEPAARYGSVQELSGDVERYLERRVVSTSRGGVTHRLLNAARRNRVASVATALGFVAVGLFAGYHQRSLRQARQRAERVQRSTRSGMEILEVGRRIALAPLEPEGSMRSVLTDLRDSLASGESRRDLMDESFPIGCAHLALGELDEAVLKLRSAWARGIQSEDAARTLAEGLLRKYRSTALEIETTRPPSERERAFQIAKLELRDPALELLENAGDWATERRDYERAQVEFSEGRFGRARTLAVRAFEQTPWLYEAAQLVGDVDLVRSIDAARSGDALKSRELWLSAGEAYRRAIDAGRSDPGTYLSECLRWSHLVDSESLDRALEDATARQAIETCDDVLQVDPEMAVAHAAKARIYWRWADMRGRNLLDSEEASVLAIESADRALDLAPGLPVAWLNLGRGHLVRARARLWSGRDPQADLIRAKLAFRVAAAKEPRQPDILNNLANAELAEAQYLTDRGRDPRLLLEAATRRYENAIELSPEDFRYPANRGIAQLRLGAYLLNSGIDPSSALEEAVTSFRQARRLKPGYDLALAAEADAYTDLIEWSLRHGQSARADLERLQEIVAEAKGTHPDLRSLRGLEADQVRLEALALLLDGQDPLPMVERGLRAVERGRELVGEDFWLEGIEGALRVIEARGLQRLGRDPSEAFRKAIASIKTAERLNPTYPKVLTWKVEALLFYSRFLAESGGPVNETIGEAESALDRLQQVRPAAPATAALMEALAQLTGTERATPSS